MKIRSKLLLIITAMSLIMMISIGGLLFAYFKNTITEYNVMHLQTISELKQQQLDDHIKWQISGLEHVSSRDIVIDYVRLFTLMHYDYSSVSDVSLSNMPINYSMKNTPLNNDYLRKVLKENVCVQKNFDSMRSLSVYPDFDNENKIGFEMMRKELSRLNSRYSQEFFNKTIVSDNDLLSALEKESLKLLSEDAFTSGSEGFFIMDLSGKVILSTMPELEHVMRRYEKYFIEGKGDLTVDMYVYDLALNRHISVISMPLRDGPRILAVVVVVIDDKAISKIMRSNSGMGKTGETYLVNDNQLLVTDSVFSLEHKFKTILTSKEMQLCQKGVSGGGKYADYRNVDVLGWYSWMKDYDLCIFSEIDYSEAADPLSDIFNLFIWVSIIMLLSSIILMYILSRMFSTPINNLLAMTREMKHHRLVQNYELNTRDEISDLANALKDTSQELSKAESIKANYASKLQTEIELKTSELTEKVNELDQMKKALINIMEDMKESNTHLKELDNAKTAFLNVASHELKTPLTAISAYLDVLDDMKGNYDADTLKAINAIKRNSSQLYVLITNILEISRIESGRFEINTKEIDPVAKISFVLSNLRILAENKGIVLKSEFGTIVHIETDEMRFEEILNNLLSNAIKFTDKGQVLVKAHTSDSDLIVEIIDTGIGIPQDKMKNLFQNFYQVDAGLSRKYGGTGLGLSITKKIIELQGGNITVQSIEGKGTTFKFMLPIKFQNKCDIIKQ